MAGYSTRSLADKLGIKPNSKIIILHAPDVYGKTLGNLPSVVIKTEPNADEAFIQTFVTEKSKIENDFPKLKAALVKDGMLWICWPKKTSLIPTDLNENIIREIGLDNGLVDVKVAAIDENWSGLKFVYRLKDRS